MALRAPTKHLIRGVGHDGTGTVREDEAASARLTSTDVDGGCGLGEGVSRGGERDVDRAEVSELDLIGGAPSARHGRGSWRGRSPRPTRSRRHRCRPTRSRAARGTSPGRRRGARAPPRIAPGRSVSTTSPRADQASGRTSTPLAESATAKSLRPDGVVAVTRACERRPAREHHGLSPLRVHPEPDWVASSARPGPSAAKTPQVLVSSTPSAESDAGATPASRRIDECVEVGLDRPGDGRVRCRDGAEDLPQPRCGGRRWGVEFASEFHRESEGAKTSRRAASARLPDRLQLLIGSLSGEARRAAEKAWWGMIRPYGTHRPDWTGLPGSN